jgi:uncharacterized protein YraI
MIWTIANTRWPGLAAAAGVALAMSAGAASAAPTQVISNTNMRLGPGTNFGIVATVPGGSVVEITNCGGEWCTALWRGRTGYMIATNLALGGPVGPVGGPPVVLYDDPPPYFGPPYRYGPRYRYRGPRYRYRRW